MFIGCKLELWSIQKLFQSIGALNYKVLRGNWGQSHYHKTVFILLIVVHCMGKATLILMLRCSATGYLQPGRFRFKQLVFQTK